MAVTEILDPQPGEKILDLAAAPGGKATHICARMRDRGLLVANDVGMQRASDLAGNLERWGAHNAVITSESPERLADFFGPFFDRVLVDAPCSGEGLFRKNPAARLEWSAAGVQQCALRQSRLLEQAVRLVRPGGSLVYSTCTFAPEENESVAARLLEEHPDFQIAEPPALPGVSPGRADWLPAGQSSQQISRSVRLWPHQSPGEGHFIARFRRDPGLPPPQLKPARWSLSSLAQREFDLFQSRYLQAPIEPGATIQQGDKIYRPPEASTDLGGLRVVHPGWHVGRMQGERFEPSHWLATGLRMDEARLRINFDAEDPALGTFLRGGGQEDTGEAGWVLVGVAGYPLGWGKRTAGRLNSKIPRGLRLR
jgi:NOL1/NOP2/fmu family ribosome biogenesis protein/precorrin-6B methylase 2